MGELAQFVPFDQVAGSAVRFDWLLVRVSPPLATSRNMNTPAPLGPSTASQYFVPLLMLTAGMATEFHAAFVGLVIVAWLSNPPGLLLASAYTPTTTRVAVLPLST